MNKAKITVIAIISTIMNLLGILAVPVFLLVGCNVMDYATGLLAAPYRKEEVKSYKSIRGITKKVCMWLLVIVGAWIDVLIQYTVSTIRADVNVPFIVATIVAVWLVVNEIISILENMIDIGVNMPPFLMPLVKRIKGQIEEKADKAINDKEGEHNED